MSWSHNFFYNVRFFSFSIIYISFHHERCPTSTSFPTICIFNTDLLVLKFEYNSRWHTNPRKKERHLEVALKLLLKYFTNAYKKLLIHAIISLTLAGIHITPYRSQKILVFRGSFWLLICRWGQAMPWACPSNFPFLLHINKASHFTAILYWVIQHPNRLLMMPPPLKLAILSF